MISTGLSLSFFIISSYTRSSGRVCLCRLLLVLLLLFCLVFPVLPYPGLAADSGMVKPAGKGKMAVSTGKKNKSALQTATAKNSFSQNQITKKSSDPKGKIKSDGAKKRDKAEPNHGAAWKFGTGKNGQKTATEGLKRGINSAGLRKRAVVNRKEPLPEVKEEDMIVNPMLSSGKKKSSFSIGFDHERSSWNNGPSSNRDNPGENYTIEGRNVIRGTTSVEAGKNLSIDLGPELILKDQKARENLNNSSQPDSSFGLGMHFKFGF